MVLFQLGGPDSLDAVEPFLYNLFSDPDIIDFPLARLARRTLARLVARNRAAKVRERYAQIGGCSPIIELTQHQAAALERELQKHLPARVFVAMRYWHPLTEEVVAEIERNSFDQLVLLPLYPQYSRVTAGSSLNEWNRRYQMAARNHIPVKTIRHYYDHPLYLEALTHNLNQALAFLHFQRCDLALKGPLAVLDLPSGIGISRGTVDHLRGFCLERLGPDYHQEARIHFERAAASEGATLESALGPGVAPLAEQHLKKLR